MIQPGQIYRSCDPRESIRIRITAYRPGDARAQVVDAVTGKRFRQILVKDLHESPVTATGRRRRSGYVLDRDVTKAAEEAPDGSQERLEGVSATPASPEGQNGPQAGAEGLGSQQAPRGPVDWARHYADQRATAGAPDETETLKATIARVRKLAAELFVEGATHTHRAIGRQILNALQPPVPDETTPADEGRLDRAHWADKYAGEGQ